ncbi:MAG: hypothetical protein H0U70_01890 [Tatlockia sp.]|nr:hypothetical protein [Tatlockia sp.]
MWAVAGQQPFIYQGMVQFIFYILQSRVQERWHQHTGYLPLGVEGIYSITIFSLIGFSKNKFTY